MMTVIPTCINDGQVDALTQRESFRLGMDFGIMLERLRWDRKAFEMKVDVRNLERLKELAKTFGWKAESLDLEDGYHRMVVRYDNHGL